MKKIEKKKKVWIWVVFVLALLIILLVAYLVIRKFQPTTNNPCLLDSNLTVVNRVIDGNTFELCSGETVKLLCVNTPQKGQDGYEDAKNFLKSLILYKEVTLAPSNYNGNDTDKYGRSLRWVYFNDENSGQIILINKYILEEGYGDLMIIPPETCNEVSD